MIMRNLFGSQARRGFTLVELLVVIAIIGILVGLLLPAIQAAREAARRMSCANNLYQMSVAITNYQMAHQVLPPGTVNDKGPIVHIPVGFHHNWIVQILPMLDERLVYKNIKHDQSVYSAANAPVRAHTLTSLVCPSTYNLGPFSNYAGVHHSSEAPIDVNNNGLFFLNSRVSYDDITDGLAYTLAIGEKDIDTSDLGWGSGTRASLRNLGHPFSGVVWTGMGSERMPPGLVLADAQGKFLDDDQDGIPDDSMDMDGVLVSSGSTDAYEPPAFGDSSEAVSAVYSWTVYPGDPATWLPISQLPEITPGTANNGTGVGGFSSAHSSTVNFAVADGSVRAISTSIDAVSLSRLGARADGAMIKSLDAY
jgi:prepilin-type N-terminal cleavage/methylation domain-containing protein